MNFNALIYLLVNFFEKEKHITSVAILTCSGQIENVRLLKSLSFNNFSVLSMPINEMDGSKVANNLLSHGLNSLGVYLDYTYMSSEKIIESCDACFSTRFKWLIYDTNEADVERSILKQLDTTHLFIDAEIMCVLSKKTFSNMSSVDMYGMYDVFNNAFTNGGTLKIIQDRYFIVPSGNVSYFTDSSLRTKAKYVNRNTMSDTTLRFGVVLPNHERFEHDEDLIRYLLTDNNTSVDTLSRYATSVGLLFKDALMFNVTYERYSRWASNDTYGELIEGVATGKVDFGLAFFLLTIEREKHYAPITQISEFRSRFYFLTTVDVDYYGKHFLMPFVSSIWLCILGMIILVSSMLWLIQLNDTSNDSSTLLITFGVFCQQGAAITPNLVSGRCLFIFLLLSAYCMFRYYTSILVSTLVKSGSKNQINTISDLSKSQLKVGFEEIPYIHSFLNTTQDPEIQSFIANKVDLNDNSYFVKSHEGLKLVQQQRYAFHCEANTAFPIIRSMFSPREICDLNVLPFRHDKMQAFVIRKQSPFHDIFAIKAFWMRETGIISKHQRHWMATKPACLSNALFTSIDFASTVASVELLIVGYSLSILILLIELAVYRKMIPRIINALKRSIFDVLPSKRRQIKACSGVQRKRNVLHPKFAEYNFGR